METDPQSASIFTQLLILLVLTLIRGYFAGAEMAVASVIHWLDCHQEERCIYAFERTDGKERIAAVFNFSDEEQKGYKLPVEDAKELEVILASDDETFGGCKKYTKKKVKVTDGKAVLDLSAYSAVYYSIAV